MLAQENPLTAEGCKFVELTADENAAFARA